MQEQKLPVVVVHEYTTKYEKKSRITYELADMAATAPALSAS